MNPKHSIKMLILYILPKVNSVSYNTNDPLIGVFKYRTKTEQKVYLVKKAKGG